MRFALFAVLLFACKKDKDGPTDPPSVAGDPAPGDRTKAPPPAKDPPPCPGIDGALADAVRGDLRRVQTGDDGRVQVVVTPGPAGFTAPATFTETARADGLIQGWLAADQICTLAASPGVAGLRAAILAKPKEGTP